MNDEDVVRRFQEIVGVGTIRTWKPKNPRHSTQYRWRVCSWEKTTAVIEMFRPYLGHRRLARVAEFEAFRDAPRKRPRQRERMAV
jgi:hypothetical protein